MHRPPFSWTTLRTKLGSPRKSRKPKAKSKAGGRKSRIESLKIRQLLSADPILTDFVAFGQERLELDKNVFVDGDATSAGEVDLSSNVVITGTTTEFGTPELFTPIVLPTLTSFTTDPNNDIDTNKDETTTLAPGLYGDLELGKNNVLNLSAGSYFFDEIDAEKYLELNLDVSGGNIEIFVAGKVTFAKELDVTVIGGDASDIYLESHDRFKLEKDGEWLGTIYAPDDKIKLHKNTTLVGAAYSGDKVLISKDSLLELVASDRLVGGNTDTTPPSLTASLTTDTGDNSDGVTSVPTISGMVTDPDAARTLGGLGNLG